MRLWVWVIVCAGLLACGCQSGKRMVVQDTAVLQPRGKVEQYQLVRVEPNGDAMFRTSGVNVEGTPYKVRAGQQVGRREQNWRGRKLEYTYKLLSSDPREQKVVVLITILEK